VADGSIVVGSAVPAGPIDFGSAEWQTGIL
jgi:hypothetical protein